MAMTTCIIRKFHAAPYMEANLDVFVGRFTKSSFCILFFFPFFFLICSLLILASKIQFGRINRSKDLLKAL